MTDDDYAVELMTGGTASARNAYALEPTRPARGIPTPKQGVEQNDVRLSNIATKFRTLLGLTVRHGRLTGANKDVMGQYNRRTTAIRLRTWTDLSTLVHEGGHALNDMMAGPLDALVQARASFFRNIATTIYAGDLKGDPKAELREGFAEFFRIYALTPDYARKKWNTVTTEFEQLLDKEDPKLRAGLNVIADDLKAWLQLPSSQLIRNTVIDGRREQGINAAVKELKDLGFKSWVQEYTRRAVQASVNRYASMNQLVAELLNHAEQNRGVPLDVNRSDDPRTLIRLARNAGNRGMVEVNDGVQGYRSTQAASHGLREALMVSQGVDPNTTPGSFDEERLKDFSTYLVARRALDEYRRLDAGEIERPPINATRGDVIRTIKDYEKQYKDSFTKAAAIVHEYGMALWQKQYDAGLMPKETYEEGLTRQFYVPLQRDLSDKRNELGPSALTSKGGPLRSIVKRFKGSDRDIIDPISVLMHKTFALEALIAENDVKRALAVLADKAGAAGALVERIPANQLIGRQYSIGEVARQLTKDDDISEADAADLMTILEASIEKGSTISMFRSEQASTLGENILLFWENGKVAAIQLKDGSLGADVVNTMNAVGRENLDWWVAAVAGTSSAFRTAITSWPDFLLVNFIRDQMSAFVLNEGYIPFVSGIKGMVDEIRQKQWAKSYNSAQGIMGGMVNAALHEAHVERDIRALRAKGYLANVFGEMHGAYDLLGVTKGLARISALSETGTRLGLYRAAHNRATKDGLSDYDASVEAAYIATDYIDFGLNGSRMTLSRRLVPFLNAQLQGFYKLVRTLGGDEVRQRKGLKFVLGAYFKNVNGLALSRVEKQQLNTGRSAWIKMMSLGVISAALYFLFRNDPDYQEAGEYLRATGWVFPMGNGRVFYIPKPFEIAMIANATERGLEMAAGDSQAPGRFMRGVGLTLIPPTSPPAFQIATELAANYDFFTGRPIVPDYMQALEPELQYDNYTTGLARWMGATFNWSPMVVDHVLSGLGSSAYRDLTTALNAADPSRPAPDETDAPILRRFVRDVKRGSASAQDFWAQASQTGGALERAAQTYKHYLDIGNEPAANSYLDSLDGDQRAYATLMTKFDTDAKRLNPFYRARQLTTIISGMRREISSDLGLADTTVKDELASYAMTAGTKQQVDELLSEIARREVRNTLVATKQPGWQDKQPIDVQPTLDMLQQVSPDTYDEYTRRVHKKRVYNADEVYQLWPDVRDRLISDGEYAVLTDAEAVASAGI